MDQPPPLGCDYTGRHFGGSYDDAVCIEGHLWDLDSYEDGQLTSGGSIPCPRCNLNAWVETAIENCADEFDDEPYISMTRVLLSPWMRGMHGLEAFRRVARHGLVVDWYGGKENHDGPCEGRIALPWPLPDDLALSAHERVEVLRIMAQAPIPPGFATDAQGRTLGPALDP